MAKRESAHIAIQVAARRTGLSSRTVRRYVRRGLVDEALTEADVTRLRRIRRLTELGINLAGVEAILRMRHRIETLEARLQASPRPPEMPETWLLILPGERDEAE
jgi:MerR family transcriptional regulator/heat shock protein HspR